MLVKNPQFGAKGLHPDRAMKQILKMLVLLCLWTGPLMAQSTTDRSRIGLVLGGVVPEVSRTSAF